MSVDSVELPVYTLPDGRRLIRSADLVERPEVASFVRRFPDYWVMDARWPADEPVVSWASVIADVAAAREHILRRRFGVSGGYPAQVLAEAVAAVNAAQSVDRNAEVIAGFLEDWEHNEAAWDRIVCGVSV